MVDLRSAFGRLTRYEKTSAMLLACFGIAALFLGVLQMRTRILTGGYAKKVAPIATSVQLGQMQQDLKKQDTDKDGLPDYDEITQYHTSPYLADSDSDGVMDGQEIAAGTDPNCPEGQVCAGIATGNGASATSTASSDTAATAPADVLGVNSNGTFDAAALRKALAGAGVDPKVLEKVDDATLKKMYEDTMKENPSLLPSAAATSAVASPAATGSASAGASSNSEIFDQIRKVLIDSGMDAATVNGLSEDQLTQLMQYAQQQTQQSP